MRYLEKKCTDLEGYPILLLLLILLLLMFLLVVLFFFGVAVVAAIIFGVDFGVAVVVGSGIFVDSGDIVAFAVVVDDDISKEWLPLLLVSAAYLHLSSLSKSIRYCRHFFVSFL